MSALAGRDLSGIMKWSTRDDWRASRQLITHVAVLHWFAVTDAGTRRGSTTEAVIFRIKISILFSKIRIHANVLLSSICVRGTLPWPKIPNLPC
jgi:hypothetical protein